MNVSMTPTAEALIQQLIELGYDDSEAIVEQALHYFPFARSLRYPQGVAPHH